MSDSRTDACEAFDECPRIEGRWRGRPREVRPRASGRRRTQLVGAMADRPQPECFFDHRVIRNVLEEHSRARVRIDGRGAIRDPRTHLHREQLVKRSAFELPAKVPRCLREPGDHRAAGKASVDMRTFRGDAAQTVAELFDRDADESRRDHTQGLEQCGQRRAVRTRLAPADEVSVCGDLEQDRTVTHERSCRRGPIRGGLYPNHVRNDRGDPRSVHQVRPCSPRPSRSETGSSARRTHPPSSALR